MRYSNVITILLVEDEVDHANLIKNVLRKNGNTVAQNIQWVKDGKEAIDYLSRKGKYTEENAPTPNIILLDIKMPILNGFEVLAKLKSDKRLRLIPVIMLTTSEDFQDISKALGLHANDYLVKPFGWLNFEEKIKEMGKYWAFTSDTTRVTREY